MTTDAKQALTQAALDARTLWGQDTAKGLLLALREAGASVGQVVDMVVFLRGLKATEGAVVALTEWTLSYGRPDRTHARHFVVQHAAKARRGAQTAQGVPAEPSLDAWMRHYDAFQAEMAVYGRCD